MTPRCPLPDPSGWFVVAYSDEVERKAVVPMRYFGRDLVLFRADDGRAHVLDAFCPHMGAHLGHGGVVDGATIACPFHGWAFDGSGSCVRIPYAERIPPRARTTSYPVHEAHGLVFVHHGDGPIFEPPRVPPPDAQEWTEPRRLRWKVGAHIQEVVEGTIDAPHLKFVHRAIDVPRCDLRPDGVELRGLTEARFSLDPDGARDPGVPTEIHLFCSGLGIVVTETRGQGFSARSVGFPTPVGEDYVDVRVLVQVRRGPSEHATAALETAYADAYAEDFERDRLIWENKTYRERPVLCENDGPIGVFRRWARQFYAEEPVSPTAPR